MSVSKWESPKEFTYLASCLYPDLIEEYLEIGYFELFHHVMKSFFVTSELPAIHDFVTRVLAQNPTNEELDRLWNRNAALIRWRGQGASDAFAAIKQASARILGREE